MADPTIYEILQNLVTDILMPIILLVLAYLLGTKGINKYQERKDKNSRRELIMRELAKYHLQEIEFLQMCLDKHEGRRNIIERSGETILTPSIIVGLSKISYSKENSGKFLAMVTKYAKVNLEIFKNGGFAISLDQFDKYANSFGVYYFQLLEFIKTTEINP